MIESDQIPVEDEGLDEHIAAAGREVTGELEPTEREMIEQEVGKEAAEDGAIIIPAQGESVGAVLPGGKAVRAKLEGGPDARGLYTLSVEGGTLTAPAEVFRDDIQRDIQRRIEQQVHEEISPSAEASPELRAGMNADTTDEEPVDIDQMGRRPWKPTQETLDLIDARRAARVAAQTPEERGQALQDAMGGEVSEESPSYDQLLDPNYEHAGSVQAAAVHEAEDEGARLARERERDDAIAWNGNIAEDRRRRGL